MAKLVKKITVRDVVGKITGDLFTKVVTLKGQVIPLMRIIGIARKAKVGSSLGNEYVRFIGSFKATNLLNGEIFASGACILPGAIPDLIFGALGGEGVQEAQFAFDIGVKYDETAITKYVYTVESLMEPGEADPLALLEAKVTGASAPALPAPPAAPEAPPAAPEAPPAAPASEKGKGKK